MTALIRFSTEKFDESMASLVWDQWLAIGGSGSVQKGEIPFVVDIEALVLATTRFGRQDPRILEQCTDWLALNGKLVSLQRVKNLQNDFGIGDVGLLRRLGSFMVEQKFPNWKAIQTAFPSHAVRAEEPRTSYVARGLSRPPNPYASEAFLLKLRNFFGVNARAEVFLWLLTHDAPGHAAEIARETGWLPKTIQVILNELEQSGLVSSYTRGRERKYSTRSEAWSVLMPKAESDDDRHQVSWLRQPPLYAACWGARRLLAELAQGSEEMVELQSMKIRKESASIRENFAEADLRFFVDYDARRKGGEMVEYFLDEMSAVSGLLDARKCLKTRFWAVGAHESR